MKFNESQFFDACDNLDAESTEQLLSRFKMLYTNDFGSDMYDFISDMQTKDAVLLLIIATRFMNSMEV